MDKISLAVVGATGIVGQEILSLLADETFEPGLLQLSASDDSVGEVYEFRGKDLEVVAPDKLKFEEPTLLILCSPRDVSQNLISSLRPKSLATIDCSGLDRSVSELAILPDAINATGKSSGFSVKTACGFIVTSFLNALELGQTVTGLVATTLEPVSGAGRSGLDELWNQTRAIFNQTPTDPEFFPEQIAFNIISQVDVMRDDGITAYEQRVTEELQSAKVSNSHISVTALRVPVMYGCGVSLTFETTKKLSVESICNSLSISPRFVVDQAEEQPPSTMSVIGDDRIHIARIRIRMLEDNKGSSVSCWLLADNIRACIARPIVDLYRSLMPVE